MTAVRQALTLVGIAIVAAVLLWAVRPDRLPLVADAEVYTLDLPAPLVGVTKARELYDAGTHYFVDTRAEGPGGSGVIPGSFVIRETSFDADFEAVMDFLYPEDPLVLYGATTPLPVAAVAVRLQSQGYENLLILQGGLAAWRDGGGSVTGNGDDQ